MGKWYHVIPIGFFRGSPFSNEKPEEIPTELPTHQETTTSHQILLEELLWHISWNKLNGYGLIMINQYESCAYNDS